MLKTKTTMACHTTCMLGLMTGCFKAWSTSKAGSWLSLELKKLASTTKWVWMHSKLHVALWQMEKCNWLTGISHVNNLVLVKPAFCSALPHTWKLSQTWLVANLNGALLASHLTTKLKAAFQQVEMPSSCWLKTLPSKKLHGTLSSLLQALKLKKLWSKWQATCLPTSAP